MCKLKSAIILKDRIFMPDYDSHEDMLDELGIKDGYLSASKTFVRVELSPKDANPFSNIDDWELIIDQDITPEWFRPEEWRPKLVEKVKEWAKTHIFVGQDNLILTTGCNYYIKDCTHVQIAGNASVQRICGNSIVSYIKGDSQIQDITDNAEINNICGNAFVCSIGDNVKVYNIHGDAYINYIEGYATIYSIYANARIKKIGWHATILQIAGQVVVECINNCATINLISGNAFIKKVSDDVLINNLYHYARVMAANDSEYAPWKNAHLMHISHYAQFIDISTDTIYRVNHTIKLVKSGNTIAEAQDI